MPYTGSIGSGQRSPTSLQKRGSDFTGQNGAPNRTYTIPETPKTDGFKVWIDGVMLHRTQQYTISGTTLTIIDGLDNTSYLDIEYFTVA